jgi:DNA uptake protein ComE-like DNA-binding protein
MRTKVSPVFGAALLSLMLTLLIMALTGCAPNQTPDQIRQQTAQATEDVKRDTKAVAEGIREGLSNKKTIDLNKASKDDLVSLPGITSPRADRIIAERPYASAHQLVTRHVLTEDEYAQIQDRVIVTR